MIIFCKSIETKQVNLLNNPIKIKLIIFLFSLINFLHFFIFSNFIDNVNHLFNVVISKIVLIFSLYLCLYILNAKFALNFIICFCFTKIFISILYIFCLKYTINYINKQLKNEEKNEEKNEKKPKTLNNLLYELNLKIWFKKTPISIIHNILFHKTNFVNKKNFFLSLFILFIFQFFFLFFLQYMFWVIFFSIKSFFLCFLLISFFLFLELSITYFLGTIKINTTMKLKNVEFFKYYIKDDCDSYKDNEEEIKKMINIETNKKLIEKITKSLNNNGEESLDNNGEDDDI